MAKKSAPQRNETTSARAATAASKVLRTSSSKPAKTAAGSALTQRVPAKKR